MKKIYHILIRVFLALILLIIGVAILFSIPTVQTFFGTKITSWLHDKYDVSISIEKIHFQWNGNTALKGVLVKDYQNDTLIAAKSLNASILDLREISNGNLFFDKIQGEQIKFYVKTYPNAQENNLSAFIEKFNDGSPSSGDVFLMNANRIQAKNSTFRILDLNSKDSVMFQLENLNFDILDFDIKGSDIKLTINDASARMNKTLNIMSLKTEFSLSDTLIKTKKLFVKTEKSELEGNLCFHYKEGELSDFLDKVMIEGEVFPSILNTNDLNGFYNGFVRNRNLKIATRLRGTLNNFHTRNLRASYQNTELNGNLKFQNLFDENKDINISGNLQRFFTIYNDLAGFMPVELGGNLPKELKSLGFVTLSGDIDYRTKSLKGDFKITSQVGNANMAIDFNNLMEPNRTTYKGNITTDQLNIGKVINNKTLGKINSKLSFSGAGFTLQSMNTNLNGTISSLVFNKYNYSNIQVNGNLQNRIFNGKIDVSDPNLKMDFSGLAKIDDANSKFDFEVDVTHAQLYNLNFIPSDSLATFNGKAKLDIKGLNFKNINGEISFKNIHYKNSAGNFSFEDFAITTTVDKTNYRKIKINSPDIISGAIEGQFKFDELKKVVQNSVGSIFINYSPYKLSEGQNLKFDLKIFNKIIDAFFPKIHIDKNTFLKGEIIADKGIFQLNFNSPSINIYNNQVDNINVVVDSKNTFFNTYIGIENLKTPYYNIKDFNLINATINDTLFFRTEFNGGSSLDDSYELNFFHTMTKNQDYVIGLKKSKIEFKNNQWFINEESNNNNKIIINRTGESIRIEDFKMTHENQMICLDGDIRDRTSKDVHLVFNQVQLKEITPNIEGLSLGGIINGNLSLVQKTKKYLPHSNLKISDLEINNHNLGNFVLDITGNEKFNNFNIEGRIIDTFGDRINTTGTVTTNSDKTSLDLVTEFNRFDLRPFTPLAQDILSDIRGFASGKIKVSGDITNLDMEGELKLENAGLGLPFLNINANFEENARIIIKNQSFIFDDITLTDTAYKTQANLSGFIRHKKFNDWYLDLNINTNNQRFLALNTSYEPGNLFYGVGFINGKANVKGPIEALTISVDAKTSEGTKFKIPLEDSAEVGDDSFITFVEKNKSDLVQNIEFKTTKGLELNFELDITPEAELEVLLGASNGGNLIASGEGTVLMEINTNGKFNIWGDFIVYSGSYNFNYRSIIDKRFILKPGGSISWNGNPMSATLRNMEAAYNLYTNPSVLLETAQYNRKIPTQVAIRLEGELLKPETLFDIHFPDSNPGLVSELNYKLEDQDKKQLQAFSLLAQGAFVSDRNAENRIVAHNLYETATGLFNQILSGDDDKLNLGLSYEAGTVDVEAEDYQSNDRLGVTINTQLNDRILINGKIGVPLGGVSRTAVAGDFEIQFLLTKDGSLSAKIFNRENELQQYLAERIGYTQGIGLSYKVDFNTFKELISEIVKIGKGEK